jgi:hypothetical protein
MPPPGGPVSEAPGDIAPSALPDDDGMAVLATYACLEPVSSDRPFGVQIHTQLSQRGGGPDRTVRVEAPVMRRGQQPAVGGRRDGDGDRTQTR